jgi:hypothetical protein
MIRVFPYDGKKLNDMIVTKYLLYVVCFFL